MNTANATVAVADDARAVRDALECEIDELTAEIEALSNLLDVASENGPLRFSPPRAWLNTAQVSGVDGTTMTCVSNWSL
jgi:hypothetical protein